MEKVRETLQSYIINKDFWIKDQDVQMCFRCAKEFNVFRRKHHCRSCGKIFCSQCSNNYFQGNKISKFFEKQLRMCQHCYKKINNFYDEMFNQTFINYLQKIINQQQNNKSYNNQEEQQNEKQKLLDLSKQSLIKEKVNKITEYLLSLNKIKSKWIYFLSTFTIRAIIDTKIDTINNSDKIDICKYAKVKAILSNQQSSQYIYGIVCRKNIASKNMTTSFINPKVMILTILEINSLTEENLIFDELVSNEKKYVKKLVDKIARFNPNVVLVQKSANKLAIEMMKEKGITVVTKIKPKLLQRIRKLCKIKIKIDKTELLFTCQKNYIIGTCSKIYFLNFPNDQSKDNTYMFIESDLMNKGVTILVIGKCLKEITLCKLITKSKLKLKELLQLTRSLALEKSIIQFQKELWKNLKKQDRIRSIDQFKIDRTNIQQFINNNQINYLKINFVSSLDKYPDIKKVNFYNYYHKNNFFNKKLQILSQICNQPIHKKMKFYNTGDISLGYYIIYKINHLEQKCQKCKKPKYDHISLYYFQDTIIKISCIGKLHEIQQVKQSKIFSFIKCENCGKQLSQNVYYKKNQLEISFFYFITCMLQKKQKKCYQQQQDRKSCHHLKISRVISSADYQIVFSFYNYTNYRINRLTFTSLQSKELISQLDSKFTLMIKQQEIGNIQNVKKNLMDNLVKIQKKYKAVEIQNKNKKISQYEIFIQGIERIILNIDKIIEEILNCNYFLSILKSSHTIFWQYNLALTIINIIQNNKKKIQNKNNKKKLIRQQDPQIYNIIQSNDQIQIIIEQNKKTNQVIVEEKLENGQKNNEWNINLLNLDQQGLLDYVPVYEDNPISFIAYGINSPLYQQQIQSKPQKIKIKVNQKKKEFKYDILDDINKIIKEDRKDKDFSQVNIYYPFQFEEIRKGKGIQIKQFIQAICGCSNWITSGGKRGSFFKSHNEIIIFKIVHQKEFNAFRKFGLQYFAYLKQKQNSLLANICGMFQIIIKNKQYYYIAMENLFFNLKKNCRVYDLKGSQINRLQIPNQNKKFTGLDTNLKLDTNGEPIPIHNKDCQLLFKSLKDDIYFLSTLEVVDYSLLVIIDKQKYSFRMGIIDYMRTYQIMQFFENLYKQYLKYPGFIPTVIKPIEYKDRFLSSIFKYFVGCPYKNDCQQ